MARGSSGRIVIDIDPDYKRGLHSALAADGLTMKEWFLGQASLYLKNRGQPLLPGIVSMPGSNLAGSGQARKVAEDPVDYQAGFGAKKIANSGIGLKPRQ